jgi:anion-transporting  ArsA/GET3 family ATPase
VLGSGTQVMMSAVERLTGLTLLEDVSEFLGAFDGMYEGFRDRAERVGELLASERTTFVLITSAEPEPIGEAEAFWQALVEHGMPFGGAVVNKVAGAECGRAPNGSWWTPACPKRWPPARPPTSTGCRPSPPATAPPSSGWSA